MPITASSMASHAYALLLLSKPPTHLHSLRSIFLHLTGCILCLQAVCIDNDIIELTDLPAMLVLLILISKDGIGAE